MKKGGKWGSCVFFDTESSGEGEIKKISNEHLIETFEQLISNDISENILNVKTCTKPLSEYQLTNLVFFHEFVVIETGSFYWSIEKGGEGIYIQHSRHEDNVRLKFNREERLQGPYWKVTQYRATAHPQGHTVRSLIYWLWDKNELHKRYNYLLNNCKDQSRRVYNFLTSEMSAHKYSPIQWESLTVATARALSLPMPPPPPPPPPAPPLAPTKMNEIVEQVHQGAAAVSPLIGILSSQLGILKEVFQNNRPDAKRPRSTTSNTSGATYNECN